MQPNILTKFIPIPGAKHARGRVQVQPLHFLLNAASTSTSESSEQPEERRLRRHIRHTAIPTATSESGERTLRVRESHAYLPASTPTTVNSEYPERRLRRQTRSIVKPSKASNRGEDVDHGAFASLVVRPAATLLEVARQTFATARRSSSFTALLSDPSGGSREMLDELALAYRVRRREGSQASGRIRVFSSEDIYTTIGLSDRFDANGYRFRVLAVQSARPTDDPVSTLADTQNLRPNVDGSGYYFFDIDVTATANGSAANLVKGTELDMPDGKPPYFVRAVVLETFTGGENDETDPSLVDRMRLGLSAKVLGSRLNMKSALLETFPSIRDSSIIGAGDVEMSRDKHSVFPGSTGGYVDWYVGTTRQLQTGYFTTGRPGYTGPERTTMEAGNRINFVTYDD